MEKLNYRVTSAAEVRAAIANLFASASPHAVKVGCVDLQAHQVEALSILRKSFDEFGGALLSDPVGTGKTYTALALAGREETVLVVAPAGLKDMWTNAAATAERGIVFLSFEALSRGSSVDVESGLLIVDEAHHARNPRTRRYAGLSRLCSGRRVLLLSATPIHNRRKDLQALLSLFMGARATSLSSAETARCVIRRSRITSALTGLPRADEVVWCHTATDARMPAILLDLPPPLPPRDGGDGGALVIHSLIRQWASSDSALIGGLRRRLARAEALISALKDGTWPSRSELATWISGDDSIQLALPNFLAAPTENSRNLLPVVRRHRDALESALAIARRSNADSDRAGIIRQLRGTQAGRKIVVFSQYADTVDGMFMRLCRDGHVAALSGAGGRVAGGVISRRELIERFAPRASGVPRPRTADDVTLLITTDLLSEGVNLQDAAVVVHLDLPWTPARIEQRLGRIARIGSLHDRVQSFAFRPPASADAILRIERILKRKLEDAGAVSETLPAFGEWIDSVDRGKSSPLQADALATLIESWRRVSNDCECAGVPVAAVHAPIDGFLAALRTGDNMRFAGCIGDRVSNDLAIALECAQLAVGGDTDAQCSPEKVMHCYRELMRWVASNEALVGARESSSSRASARNNAARRIERAARNAKLHERSGIIQKANAARASLARTFGAHDENALAALCEAGESDGKWLDQVAALGKRATSSVTSSSLQETRLVAMILLVAGPS